MTPQDLIASLRFKVQHSAKKVAETLEGLAGSSESNELADFGCRVMWPLVRNYGRDFG